MSLASQVNALATRIGQEIKAVRSEHNLVQNVDTIPLFGASEPTTLFTGTRWFDNGIGCEKVYGGDNLWHLTSPTVSVKAATTANLATLTGSVDGVTIGLGDTVLVKDQTVASSNGIYEQGFTGNWTRVRGLDHPAGAGALVTVNVRQGTVNAGRVYASTYPETGAIGTASWKFLMLSGVDTGWVNLTPQTNFTSRVTPQYRVIGGQVWTRGAVSWTASGGFTSGLLSIPAAYRPPADTSIPMSANTTVVQSGLIQASTGAIQFYASAVTTAWFNIGWTYRID